MVKKMGKNLTGFLVTVTLAVIIIGSVLVPVISNAAATEDTFTNSGYARYSAIDSTSSDEIVIEWDYTNPTVFSVNGEDVDCSEITQYTSIVFGDDWNVRFVTNGTTYGGIQYIGTASTDYLQVTTAGTANFTATLLEGTATITDGTTTYTTDYTTAYYVDSAGDMIMKYKDETAYVLKSSSIINASGNTVVSSASIGVRFDGTISDGYEFTFYRNSISATASDAVSNYEDVTTHEDLVEISSITFNLTPEGGDATEVTYNVFLVPYEVTAERSAHLDSASIAIVVSIPVIVLIGALFVVVRYLHSDY